MIKDLFSLVSSFKGSDSVAYYNENTVYSFDDLYRWSVSISDALREQGLKQGDKVVVLADKSPKSMAVFFACLISGLVFCPVDRRAPRARLMDILNRLKARLIVGDEISFSSIDQNFWSDLEGELIQLSLENIEISENAGPIELIEDYEDLLAYIIFTSGSTGRPSKQNPVYFWSQHCLSDFSFQ